MTGPSRSHYDLIDERCAQVVHRVITLLEERKAAYVLVGVNAV